MVYFDDETGESSEEFDPKFKIVGLVNGIEKYPELKILLPARPNDALGCEACQGTGRGIIEEKVYDRFFCGSCSGLGWRPKLK